MTTRKCLGGVTTGKRNGGVTTGKRGGEATGEGRVKMPRLKSLRGRFCGVSANKMKQTEKTNNSFQAIFDVIFNQNNEK